MSEQTVGAALEEKAVAEKARLQAIDEHIANAPETPWHLLLDEFINTLPTNFVARYEKLVGRSPSQVKAQAEAKFPKTE